MKRFLCLMVCGMIWMMAAAAGAAFAQAALPAVGGPPPELGLPAPEDPAGRAYLGIGDRSAFSYADIAGDGLIIEIFSMYCPHCQREAPLVNRLHERILQRPDARDRLRLIGIGVGNSGFEVDYFKKTYDIAFPLFADGDFVLHKRFGEARTPYFVVVALKGEKAPAVVFSRPGGIGDPDAFLDQALKLLDTP